MTAGPSAVAKNFWAQYLSWLVLLLYGGAVQLAGSVTARKNQRATMSGWMDLEKKRGISISSTVLQFDYNGCRLLQHAGFFEDPEEPGISTEGGRINRRTHGRPLARHAVGEADPIHQIG